MGKIAACSLIAPILFAGLLSVQATASAQIRSPGNHVHYALDVEPHLVVQWADEEGFDEGFGLGVRGSIPIIDNGPLPRVNNTLALTAGLDMAFFSENCNTADCNAWQLWLPVAAQWNFYFSHSLALFGELGLAFQYINAEINTRGAACDADNFRCSGWDDLDLEPVFWVGGRYIPVDNMAFTMRLGFPSLTIGASFFM